MSPEIKKKKIIFYTDCFIFGGCEKPIFRVMTSQQFLAKYDYRLIYRKNREYIKGLNISHPHLPKDKSSEVTLFDISTFTIYLSEKIKNKYLLRVLIKLTIAIYILFMPVIFIYDYIILYMKFLKEKPDIVHINNGGYPGALSCRAASVAARYAGIKNVILNVHNIALKSIGYFDRKIDYFVKKSVVVIITGSKSAGRALTKNRGFESDKIITIYHGVDRVACDAGVSQNENSLAGSDGRHISMVGRFENRKGHRYAIAAFKKMLSGHKELSDLKLLLIGDGPILSEMKRLVADEGLAQNVIFLGHRNDYMNYVSTSLFLLHPSIEGEDLPYIILEAMAAGVSVIGTDVAGIPEEIEDGVTGIILKPKDTGAIVSAMFRLLSDDSGRKRMGDESKKRFQNLFLADKMIDNYLKLYDNLKTIGNYQEKMLCQKSA